MVYTIISNCRIRGRNLKPEDTITLDPSNVEDAVLIRGMYANGRISFKDLNQAPLADVPQPKK